MSKFGSHEHPEAEDLEVKILHSQEINIPIIIPKTSTMLVHIVKSMGLMAVQKPVIIVRPHP